MRWRIDLAYDGTDFHGWAAQPSLRTVEGTLTEAIARIARLPQPPTLVVAGRTDAGVHARGQVCHLDFADDATQLLHPLRSLLPADIAIHNISEAPAGFDARFSAIWRRYCYRLIEADAPPDPLLRYHVATVKRAVDVEALTQAAAMLVGLRDFAAFCKAREGATTIRELQAIAAARRSDGVIEIGLRADAFCHSMVRSLIGALTAVASGQRDFDWLAMVLAQATRHNQVHVMPARGLVLEEVGYPADEQLAKRANEARAMRTLENT